MRRAGARSGSGFSSLDLFARAVGEVAHALGVGPGAIGPAFEQGRAAAVARRALDGLARGLVDRQHIVAVEFDAGHAVAGAAVGHAGIAGGVSNGTSVAYWLFSQTKRTGSFQMPAMFSPS